MRLSIHVLPACNFSLLLFGYLAILYISMQSFLVVSVFLVISIRLLLRSASLRGRPPGWLSARANCFRDGNKSVAVERQKTDFQSFRESETSVDAQWDSKRLISGSPMAHLFRGHSEATAPAVSFRSLVIPTPRISFDLSWTTTADKALRIAVVYVDDRGGWRRRLRFFSFFYVDRSNLLRMGTMKCQSRRVPGIVLRIQLRRWQWRILSNGCSSSSVDFSSFSSDRSSNVFSRRTSSESSADRARLSSFRPKTLSVNRIFS